MAFLSPGKGGGYPAEYLLARIGGRRGALISQWEPLLVAPDPLAAVPATHLHGTLAVRSDEEVWGSFLREASWLFRQMNGRLRGIFAPVFSWFEIRTVALALRFGAGGEASRVDRLLAPSLLAAGVKRILAAEGDPQARADNLARLLAEDDLRYRVLAPAYREGGVQGVEEAIVTIFLERAVHEGHPAVTDFFRSLVDTLNILFLYKQLRWRPGRAPLFLTGGRVSTRELSALHRSGGTGGPSALVSRLAGEEVTGKAGIEPRLLAWLSKRLRRLGRDPDGIGAILCYLWRCYLETRNLSLLVHTRGADRERIREELVR